MIATAAINLQNYFLKIVEAEIQRRDNLKEAYNQAHVLWQASVNTHLGQINAALVAAGQPGN